MGKNHLSRGFTLVEIVITITVIAVVTTLPIVAYSGLQKNGRDTRRKQDLDNLNTAIIRYKNETGTYPIGTDLSVLQDQGYVQNLPADPLENNPDYQYLYESADGSKYVLYGRLEEKQGNTVLYYVAMPEGGATLEGTPTIPPITNTPPPPPFSTPTPVSYLFPEPLNTISTIS